MRVALIHDYLNQRGGAERVLLALKKIFPDATIYTLLYDKARSFPEFRSQRIRTSFLQRIPLARSRHRWFPFLMPLGIEQFDLSDYDVVISSSHAYAHGVVTKPETLHICYCHTPMRYAWDDSQKYIREFGYTWPIQRLLPFLINYLRLWNRLSADRVDSFIANSQCVARRINKYYRREAKVIYPPVEVDRFHSSAKRGNYLLVVSRLLPYKRIELAIQACNKLRQPLKIVGSGPEERNLRSIAGPSIEFLGSVPDKVLPDLYAGAAAFLFPQEEDFGITPVEAMAAGVPVVAYRAGGALETVREGETGIYFDKQSADDLAEAIKKVRRMHFEPERIRSWAEQFSTKHFMNHVRDHVTNLYEKYHSNYSHQSA